MSRTTVVLTNWKRVNNLQGIAAAFKQQTLPPASMILVDNHPEHEQEFAVPEELRAEFDDVHRFGNNAGPCCRFAGAGFVTTEFVLFFDDDMLPGKLLLESAEQQADELRGEFATIGDVGRLYGGGGAKPLTIRRRNVSRSGTQPTPVDMTCRAHLVRAELVAVAVRDRITAAQSGASSEMLRNDDIFLSQGIQLETKWKSYLARSVGSDGRFRRRNLASPHSCNGLPGHNESRDQLVNWYAQKGWTSLR